MEELTYKDELKIASIIAGTHTDALISVEVKDYTLFNVCTSSKIIQVIIDPNTTGLYISCYQTNDFYHAFYKVSIEDAKKEKVLNYLKAVNVDASNIKFR